MPLRPAAQIFWSLGRTRGRYFGRERSQLPALFCNRFTLKSGSVQWQLTWGIPISYSLVANNEILHFFHKFVLILHFSKLIMPLLQSLQRLCFVNKSIFISSFFPTIPTYFSFCVPALCQRKSISPQKVV